MSQLSNDQTGDAPGLPTILSLTSVVSTRNETFVICTGAKDQLTLYPRMNPPV